MICPHLTRAIRLAIITANMRDLCAIAEANDGISDDAIFSLFSCISWLGFDADEFMRRTWVKITVGKHRGKCGSIAGTLEDREKLKAYGLNRTIVRVELTNEYYPIRLDHLQALSAEETILLGLS